MLFVRPQELTGDLAYAIFHQDTMLFGNQSPSQDSRYHEVLDLDELPSPLIKPRRMPKRIISWRGPRMVCFLLGALIACAIYLWYSRPPPPPWWPLTPFGDRKPEGFKVVGLIFYGRRDRVEVLDCYLKRNLAINGGYLDRVEWVANTKDEQDLEYLDELVQTSTAYKRVTLDELGFESIWQTVERGTLYIKIDDDVVYIDDDAISQLVETKLSHPEAFVVSANIINSPFLGWLHYRMGALHPYLPEIAEPYHSAMAYPTWRASSLPYWTGPSDYTFPIPQKETPFIPIPLGAEGGPPRHNHRWLPLPRKQDIYRTPVAHVDYSTFGFAWHSWAIAAQQHYSFLENLEKHQQHLYHIGDNEGLWETSYQRQSINFMAIWGDDVLDNLPFTDVDEQYLTVDVPKKLGKAAYVNTRALVAHFSFVSQPEVIQTDLLDRYKAYAAERVCPGHVFKFASHER
ncbi:MAG: hypothetical protein M1834_008696 [Cirrosporium novae-zelandiae]|nr:MAG: hypothetical protein M1834_008696 [Cirrosporium novae-zelandiae]